MTKLDKKAEEYAKDVWKDYSDKNYPDIAIEFTYSEITQIDFKSGYNQALQDFHVKEMRELLDESKKQLSRLKSSMLSHPDCTEGSEFDDYTSLSQDLENEIQELLNKTPKL